MHCIFCDIVSGKKEAFVVWKNRDFLLFLDINPINPGHLLLIPKKHIEDVFDVPDVLYTKLFKIAKKAVPILSGATNAKRIGLAVEGFGVSHAHIHLVPVNKGNQLNPERAKKMSEKKLRELQEKLTKAFVSFE